MEIQEQQVEMDLVLYLEVYGVLQQHILIRMIFLLVEMRFCIQELIMQQKQMQLQT